MKRLLLLAIAIFLTSSACYSAPNYDPNQKPIIYDTSYNVALRNKLENDYDKKYRKCDKDSCVYNAPLGAYGQEVILPYDLNKKTYQETIIRK